MFAPVFSFAVVILRSCCFGTFMNEVVEILGDIFELKAVRTRRDVDKDISSWKYINTKQKDLLRLQ